MLVVQKCDSRVQIYTHAGQVALKISRIKWDRVIILKIFQGGGVIRGCDEKQIICTQFPKKCVGAM